MTKTTYKFAKGLNARTQFMGGRPFVLRSPQMARTRTTTPESRLLQRHLLSMWSQMKQPRNGAAYLCRRHTKPQHILSLTVGGRGGWEGGIKWTKWTRQTWHMAVVVGMVDLRSFYGSTQKLPRAKRRQRNVEREHGRGRVGVGRPLDWFGIRNRLYWLD